MSELGKNLKELVLKGIDAIGDTASNLAACTRQKMNVLSIQNRKNEILESFGNKAYEAWKNGTVFPDELAADLREVKMLEDELCQMKNAEQCEENPEQAGNEPETQQASCDTEEPAGPEHSETGKTDDVPVINIPGTEDFRPKDTPLSDAIDNLFSNPPQMDRMADRINTSLDAMGKQLLQFSSDFGKKLSDMADEIMSDNDKKDE